MKLLVDLLLVAIIIGFTVFGIKRGFIKSLISFFKNIIAFFTALLFSSYFTPWIEKTFFSDSDANTIAPVVSFVAVFIVAIILIMIVGAILDQFAKLPLLRCTNKILGGVLGIAMGVFWAFVVSALVRISAPYWSESIALSTLDDGFTLYNFFTHTAPDFLMSII